MNVSKNIVMGNVILQLDPLITVDYATLLCIAKMITVASVGLQGWKMSWKKVS